MKADIITTEYNRCTLSCDISCGDYTASIKPEHDWAARLPLGIVIQAFSEAIERFEGYNPQFKNGKLEFLAIPWLAGIKFEPVQQ